MGRGTAVIFGALAGAMLMFPGEAAQAAAQGLSLWARSVAPVLGPFMICMLMISSRIRGGAAIRVLMGWLCGSPGGAKLAAVLQPGKKAALRLAALTGTMSPMFFLGTVSSWLNAPDMGRIILLCHIFGAALTALILPRGKKAQKAVPSPLSLSSALKESALSLLMIALCMMLGCVSAKMAGCALPHLPSWAAAALQCALEVTAGVEKLIGLSPPFLPALVCGACSFGGLSILLQNAAFWHPCGISLCHLLLIRALHGLVSFLLCLFLVNIL